MELLRFVLPFLFVRNWHDGSWEISHTRAVLFGAIALIILVGTIIAYILQSPVVYTSSV
jgi:hypothetical protein